NGVTISQDTIVTASGKEPYFTIHRLNEGTGLYEKIQELTDAGSNGNGVTMSQDTIVTASDNAPYFTIHRLNEGTGLYEKVQNLTGVGSVGRGVAIYQDTIVTASDNAPYFTVHNAEPTMKKIMFNTPPPNEAIITADYKVPYIPKSKDYVLDVTAEIQFAEGV